MRNIVIFTGAGISAESGLKTFRDSDGLWENYRVEDVAHIDAWKKNPKVVLEFYNQRRRQVMDAHPNDAHAALVRLESKHKVTIITQNIDDLHERAGSTNVLHLHGEIRKSRSTLDDKVYPIVGHALEEGMLCPNGGQLRPNVVWFGEGVPNMDKAVDIIGRADLVVVIGTSLKVAPASTLINYVTDESEKIYIDPRATDNFVAASIDDKFTCVDENATTAVTKLVKRLML